MSTEEQALTESDRRASNDATTPAPPPDDLEIVVRDQAEVWKPIELMRPIHRASLNVVIPVGLALAILWGDMAVSGPIFFGYLALHALLIKTMGRWRCPRCDEPFFGKRAWGIRSRSGLGVPRACNHCGLELGADSWVES